MRFTAFVSAIAITLASTSPLLADDVVTEGAVEAVESEAPGLENGDVIALGSISGAALVGAGVMAMASFGTQDEIDSLGFDYSLCGGSAGGPSAVECNNHVILEQKRDAQRLLAAALGAVGVVSGASTAILIGRRNRQPAEISFVPDVSRNHAHLEVRASF